MSVSNKSKPTNKSLPLKSIEEQIRDNKIVNVDLKFTPLTSTVMAQLAQALFINHSVTNLDLWETR